MCVIIQIMSHTLLPAQDSRGGISVLLSLNSQYLPQNLAQSRQSVCIYGVNKLVNILGTLYITPPTRSRLRLKLNDCKYD